VHLEPEEGVGEGGGGGGGGWKRLTVKWCLIEEGYAPMAMKFEINLSALSNQDSYVRMCPAPQTT
jgi:hypothetical protein